LTGYPLDEEQFDYDPAGNWEKTTFRADSDGYVLVGTITIADPGLLLFGHLIGMPPVLVGDTIKVEGVPFTVTSVMGHSPQDPSTQDAFLEVGVAESTSGVNPGDEVTASGEMVVTQQRTHNPANEIVAIDASSALVSHDAAGNMTKFPKVGSWSTAQTATWDAWNRLVKIEEGSTIIGQYAYDGFTRRVTKTSNEGSGNVVRHFFYSDQWQVLEERLGTSQLEDRTFVWGLRYIDDLILRDRGTERLYATHDQWHVISTVGTDGNATERYAYKAFGATQVLAPNFTTRSSSISRWETTYGAYRWDRESELYAVRFRYLHPGLGRWLSRDPIGERDSANLYQYAQNAPTTAVDFEGLESKRAAAKKEDGKKPCCPVSIYVNLTSFREPIYLTPVKKGNYTINNKTGRVFSGTMMVYCKDGTKEGPWPVQDGGYKFSTSGVRDGDDATTPEGNWSASTTKSGGTQGFLIQVPGRTQIKIHESCANGLPKAGTHGCVGVSSEWGSFSEIMAEGKKCCKKSTIPIYIRYNVSPKDRPKGSLGKGRSDPSNPPPLPPEWKN
jgi:RHS repeat-associated protein